MADSSSSSSASSSQSGTPKPTSSEALAAAETSVGQGGLAGSADEQENKEAPPQELQAPQNTTGQQPFAHDPNHYQNEVAGASRGEFGRQADLGATQGGYGNELSRGADTYAGSLNTPAATTGYIGEREQRSAGFADTGNGSFGTQPVGAGSPAGSAVGPGYVNDNAAPTGPDSGFADNYGTSSVGGRTTGNAQPNPGQRNQQEDYRPNHPDGGPDGLRTGVAPTNSAQGADEADATPTAGSRSGYEAAISEPQAQGSEATGFGSKGGSYNDEYDSANPNATGQGSPSRGDYDSQQAERNYGGASDDRTHPDDSTDYGPMPGRVSKPE